MRVHPFPTLYVATLIVSNYCIFLSMNLKTYGMIKLNDDRLLTFIGGLNVILAAVSTIAWGFVADHYAIRKVLLLLVAAFIAVGVLFPLVSTSKFLFTVCVCLLGCLNSGVMTVTGPALIQYFGMLQMRRLLPIKTTTLFLSILMAPLFIYLSLQSIGFDWVFALMAVAGVISLLQINRMDAARHAAHGD